MSGHHNTIYHRSSNSSEKKKERNDEAFWIFSLSLSLYVFYLFPFVLFFFWWSRMVFHFHEGEKTRREKGKNEDILLICDSNVCVLTRRDATLYIYLVSPFILYSFSSSSSSTVVVVVWGSGQAPDHLLLPFFSLLFFYIILQVLSLSLSLMALLLETFSKSANSFWHFSLFFASSSSLHRIVDAVALLLSAFSFAGFCGSIPIDVARVHIR